MKKTVQKSEIAAYLRGLAAASMLVVSLSSPVMEVASNIQSAAEIAQIFEKYSQYIGEGPYMIESKPGDQWTDTPMPDPVISGYAIAFTVRATLTRTGREIGGYSTLRKALVDYEYLQTSRSGADDMVTTILIKLPTAPSELQTLRELLAETTIMFSVDDGSGYFHLGNTMMGNGINHA